MDGITQHFPIAPAQKLRQPRAEGQVVLQTKPLGNRSVIDRFRQSGSFKCLFPRQNAVHLDAVLLNTAGGVTGGDQFRFAGEVAVGTTLTVTTQACERAYRAQPEQTGKIRNRVQVEAGARLNWLPQETILFDGCALDRRLEIDLALGASALMVEPFVFGRPAMGERLTDVRLRDRIEIRRDQKPAFLDAMAFDGNLHDHLARPAIADGAGAMALVVFAADTAAAHLTTIRDLLPETAGASLIRDDLLTVRLLAENSFALRSSLLPILRQLNSDTLPRCWTI